MTSSTSRLPVWRWVAPPFKQWRNRFTSAAPETNVRSQRSIRHSNRLKFGHLTMPFWWRHGPPNFRFDIEFGPQFNRWQNSFTSTAPRRGNFAGATMAKPRGWSMSVLSCTMQCRRLLNTVQFWRVNSGVCWSRFSKKIYTTHKIF